MSAIRVGKVEVKPADIAAELGKVWRERAELYSKLQQSESGVAPTHVQVTLANIIILVSGTNPKQEDEVVESLVSQLTLSHPSRFFVLSCAASGATVDKVKTFVSSRCALSQSGANICSEEIYISVTEDGVAGVPNLLLSLLVPDVEITAVVPVGEGLENSTYRKLLQAVRELSNTVIYHSLYFPNYLSGVNGLIGDKLKEEQFFVQVRDVNWERTRRWRHAVAEQFGATRAVDCVREVTEIEFVYGGGDDSKVQAPADVFVVAGWMIECLEWKLTSGKVENGTVIVEAKNSEGKPVKLTLVRSPEKRAYVGDKQSRMYGMQVVLETGVTTSFFRTDDWCLEISTQQAKDSKSQTASRRVPFLSESIADLVSREVVTSDQDKDFVKTLFSSIRLAELSVDS